MLGAFIQKLFKDDACDEAELVVATSAQTLRPPPRWRLTVAAARDEDEDDGRRRPPPRARGAATRSRSASSA